jgi:hypothetical protein
MDICLVLGLCSIVSITVFVHLDNWSNSKTAKLSVGFVTAMSALVLLLTMIGANQSSSLAFGQWLLARFLGPWLCWLVLLALTVNSVKVSYTRLEELDEVTADDAGDNRNALLFGGRWVVAVSIGTGVLLWGMAISGAGIVTVTTIACWVTLALKACGICLHLWPRYNKPDSSCLC